MGSRVEMFMDSTNTHIHNDTTHLVSRFNPSIPIEEGDEMRVLGAYLLFLLLLYIEFYICQ